MADRKKILEGLREIQATCNGVDCYECDISDICKVSVRLRCDSPCEWKLPEESQREIIEKNCQNCVCQTCIHEGLCCPDCEGEIKGCEDYDNSDGGEE